MTIVSNSDIETAQKCERMFYYSRILGIRPRELSVALRRGSFGHDMMEAAFGALLNGGVEQDAIEACTTLLNNLLNSGDNDAAELMKVFRHVSTFIYWTQRDDVGWKPVALEDRGMWDITANQEVTKDEAILRPDNLIFGYTPDIVIEFVRGPFQGQHAVLDYKFIGRYMSEVAINMAQQIPKYIIYRNKAKTDFKIHRGAFIQLNTSADVNATGHKVFLVKWVTPSKKRLGRIEYENEQWIQRVERLYHQEPDHFLRTVNKDVCNWCFFGKDLCPAEFDGKPIDKILKREYVKNDYGY